MKVILFIAALALFISPSAANANLILNPGFEDSTNYWTFSNIDLLGGYYQAKELHLLTILLSSGKKPL